MIEAVFIVGIYLGTIWAAAWLISLWLGIRR